MNEHVFSDADSGQETELSNGAVNRGIIACGRRCSMGLWLVVVLGVSAAVVQEARPSETIGVLDVPIVVTQIPAVTLPAGTDGASCDSGPMAMALPGEGGRILLINPDGKQHVLTEGFHSAADPAVSFDAKRVLFAGKQTERDLWNVYEVLLEDGQVRQVTRDAGNCRQPGYQSNLFTVDSPEPWFQLTFVSDAAGWMNENGSGPVRSLYSCRLDGSEVRRLSYNLSDDLDPFLMGDGRILYASWQRATLDRGPTGRMALFAINIEGTDNALFGKPTGKRIKRAPCVTDRGLVLFVEADEPTVDGYGQIGSVTFRRPLQSYQAVTAEGDGFVYFALLRGRKVACWSPGGRWIAVRPAACGFLILRR